MGDQESGNMLNLRGWWAVVLVISNPSPGERKPLCDSGLLG